MNKDRCPICNEINHCQMEDAINCWCMTVKIGPEVLAHVPEHLQGTHCICSNCIEKLSNQKN